MNGGPLLALAGVWLGCQVFGGSALERLGIIGDGTDPAAKPAKKKTAADKAKGANVDAGEIAGFVGGGPIGAVTGGAIAGVVGNVAGALGHTGKSIAEQLFGGGGSKAPGDDNPLGAGP